MLRARVIWLLIALPLVVTAATGCDNINNKMTYSKLRGVWYLTSTGERYDFASEKRLVLPSVQKDGGNTAAYEILANGRLALKVGTATQVVNIKKLDRSELVVTNPTAGNQKTYLRDLNQTQWAKDRAKIADGALAALKRFPHVAPKEPIVWVADPPSGDIQPWPLWPAVSIGRYRDGWNWGSIKRGSAKIESQGSGESAAYSVSFDRSVPTSAQVAAHLSKTGERVERGGAHIDVGYAPSKAKYPAGTLYYVSGGLLYSLGDGYAIGVKLAADEAGGFVPYTYR